MLTMNLISIFSYILLFYEIFNIDDTPITAAIRLNSIAIVRLLVEHGADINKIYLLFLLFIILYNSYQPSCWCNSFYILYKYNSSHYCSSTKLCWYCQIFNWTWSGCQLESYYISAHINLYFIRSTIFILHYVSFNIYHFFMILSFFACFSLLFQIYFQLKSFIVLC